MSKLFATGRSWKLVTAGSRPRLVDILPPLAEPEPTGGDGRLRGSGSRGLGDGGGDAVVRPAPEERRWQPGPGGRRFRRVTPGGVRAHPTWRRGIRRATHDHDGDHGRPRRTRRRVDPTAGSRRPSRPRPGPE